MCSSDLVVDNDPARKFKGIDDQLDKAIEVIKGQLPRGDKMLPVPPFPDRLHPQQ